MNICIYIYFIYIYILYVHVCDRLCACFSASRALVSLCFAVQLRHADLWQHGMLTDWWGLAWLSGTWGISDHIIYIYIYLFIFFSFICKYLYVYIISRVIML